MWGRPNGRPHFCEKMKKILLLILFALTLSVANAQNKALVTRNNAMHVFPYDIDSIADAQNAVNKANEEEKFGYCTWRIPTKEELQTLKNDSIIESDTLYVASDGLSVGRIRLVTKDAECEVVKAKKKEEEERYKARPRAYTVNGVRFIVQYVKGGTFMMGATPEQEKSAYNVEKPAHEVTLDDFYIGRYEVTQDLWIAVMGEDSLLTRTWNRYGRGDNYPAYMVSWDDCKIFIEKLRKLTGAKFRLPTEAEWEYAARGGVKSKNYKFSGSNDANDVSWYNRSIPKYGPMPVGMKLPNELGIYDMSGNVWEWCEDVFGRYTEEPQINPIRNSPGVNHVLRGGSWTRSSRLSRVSNRGYNKTDARYNYNGFRLVMEPKTK